MSDTTLLQSIKSKGYYADMAASQEISALTDQMYDAFKSAWMNRNSIAAFPKTLFVDVLCYHKPTFETLGIKPPATYEAYFDFCADWSERYADLAPETVLNPFANDLSLERLLESYTDALVRKGFPIQYSTAKLEKLIQKYLALKKETADNKNDNDGTPLFYAYPLASLDHESEYAYLPLSFEAEETPVFTPDADNISYFVVNPYSKHQQEAFAFIASYEAQRTASDKALLYESIHEPIENIFYPSEHAMLENTLNELQDKLTASSPDEAKEIEEEIEKQKEKITSHERNFRWAVSLDALNTYKEYARHVYISEFSPIRTLKSDDPALFDSVNSLDVARFLSTLDRKVQMMMLENGMK